MTNSFMNQNYSETIKQHYHHPLNTGRLSHPTHTAEQINPLCGDEIKIYFKLLSVAKDGGRKDLPQSDFVVENISHETRGCMICVASASVVSEFVRGKKLSAIKKLGAADVAKLLDVSISPARAQCATLVVAAIAKVS